MPTRGVEIALYDKNWLIAEGHGVDGNGFMPISSILLDAFMAYLSLQTNSLWVDTLRHVAQYDYMRREIGLVAERQGNIVTISLNGYNQNKYVDMDSSPITIAIRNDKGYSISPLDNSVTMNTMGNMTFVTLNLKTISQIQLQITP